MAIDVEIEVCRTRDLAETDKAIVAEWSEDLFGASELEHEWSDPDWCVLVRHQEQAVTHLAIIERTATAGGQQVKLGGIGGVMTPVAWQGRGFAGKAMRRSAEFMRDELGVDFGLLLCSESLVRYYARLGWQHVAGPLVFDQSFGKETWDEEAMVLPCTEQTWPEGVIDLCGPPW